MNRFTNALDDATELEIGPIKDQVQIWLAAVTQGKWTQLEMDSKLNVTRIENRAKQEKVIRVNNNDIQAKIYITGLFCPASFYRYHFIYYLNKS